MRILPRALLLALPAAALLGGCLGEDIPTSQVGGTQYGLLLNLATPLRLPAATFTATATPAGSSTIGLLTVTLTNVAPLEGRAAYQFYLVGAGTGDTVPVAARLTALRVDSTVTAAGTVATTTDSSELGTSTFFRGAGPNVTVRARFQGAQLAGAGRQFLVVTIQDDSTAPVFDASTPRPLWMRVRAATGANAVVTSGSAFFGEFDLTAPQPFTARGVGRSAFWDRFGDGRLLYSAIAENLTQPPLGYYYQPYMRDSRTRRAVAFGELRDFAGRSLFDADTLTIVGSVAQLDPARFETSEAEIGQPLATFDGVHLTLRPKLADTTLSLSTVLIGVLGDTLANRGLGTLDVLVRRGADSIPGVRIVVVPVGGNLAVGTPSPALTADNDPANGIVDQRGRVRIQRIPEGEVELIVTPPEGLAPPATPPRVRVVRRDTVALVITLP